MRTHWCTLLIIHPYEITISECLLNSADLRQPISAAHLRRLKDNEHRLLSDLDVNDIIDVLIQDNALKPDIAEELQLTNCTRRSRVGILLRYLWQEPERTYYCFVASLRHHYYWLYQACKCVWLPCQSLNYRQVLIRAL